MKITRDIAWAASRDAGNASMRAAGRKAWGEDDYNAAGDKFNELWPAENDIVDGLGDTGLWRYDGETRTVRRETTGGIGEPLAKVIIGESSHAAADANGRLMALAPVMRAAIHAALAVIDAAEKVDTPMTPDEVRVADLLRSTGVS